ncbi:MAG: adenosylcobinamide amidohydrolase [Deferribacteres bacterium]|nr:adenosylcobinamide amidohydrolase [Deferribacteres bacterium]
MIIGRYYDGIEIHRDEKIIHVRFLLPHRVISTCRVGGGLRDDLECLYNHQACEPKGHHHESHKAMTSDPAGYRRLICERHKLPHEKSATLGTAANMNNAAVVSEKFRDLEVVAVCTGGVETNAGRVGDPASVYEKDGKFEKLNTGGFENHGTINTMVFINHELTHGAMVRVVMTATEAKTAALQELAVPSRYSDGLATGTGTDQIGAASKLGTGLPLSGAGKHTKLGELIGRSVIKAIKKTLSLQNKLTPGSRCFTLAILERFGLDRDSMCAGISMHLSEKEAGLFCKNFNAVNSDPPTVAAVAAIVHLRDQLIWGILPETCMAEILGTCGAQIAAAVSGKYHRISHYRALLAEERWETGSEAFTRFIFKSFALGFREKWSNEV